MLLRVLTLCLLLPLPALAETLPDPLSDTVSDYDDALTPKAEAEIAARLAEIRAETGIHLVVVAMDRLAAHGGGNQTVEAYAKALFNAWGIGDRARNDGMLLLVVTGDRVVRFALGSGYGAVYDARAKRVIDTAILPEFSQGRIAEGVLAGVNLTRDQLIAPYLSGQPVTEDAGLPDAPGGSKLWLLLFPAFAAVVLYRRRSARIAAKTCPSCHGLGLSVTNEVLNPPSDGRDGNGMRHSICSLCGHASRELYAVAANTGFKSGRGGGFGGGSSSGGGATGRW